MILQPIGAGGSDAHRGQRANDFGKSGKHTADIVWFLRLGGKRDSKKVWKIIPNPFVGA